MLTLKRTEPKVDISIEFDPYVPLTVLADVEKVIAPRFWRAGNGRNSLVEIGLQDTTGVLFSITLTMIDPAKIEFTEVSLIDKGPVLGGLPVFNTGAWSSDNNSYHDSFVDEFRQNFRVILGPDYLRIVFDDIDSPTTILECGRLKVGITSNKKLSTLTIDAVTLEEFNRMELA